MRKKSLGEIIAEQLAEDIQIGRRRELMGTEDDLASDFQISRRSVRLALKILENQGLVGPPIRGRPRQILYSAGGNLERTVQRVGIFTNIDRSMLSSSYQTLLRLLRQGLDDNGHDYKFFAAGYGEGDRFNRDKTASYCRQYDPDIWIVQNATDSILSLLCPMGKPVIAVGGQGDLLANCHVIRYDVVSFLVHAKHLIRRRGHKRWICPRVGAHLLSDDTLVEVFAGDPELALEDVILPYLEQDRDSLIRCLEQVWSDVEKRPSLIFSSNENLVTILSWLNSKRLKVPDDVSILNLGNDAVVFDVTPDLDYYALDSGPIIRKIMQTVRNLLIDPSLEPELHGLMGDYIQGKSIREL